MRVRCPYTTVLEVVRPYAAHSPPDHQTSGSGVGDEDHERGAWWQESIQTMRSETRSRTLQEVASVARKFETRPGTAVVGWLG